MMQTFLLTLGIGAALVLLVFCIQRLLIKNGIVRNSEVGAVICTILFIVIKQIWFQSVSWWLGALVILWAVILGVNRPDLWTTANRGRWWWKTNDNGHT